MPPPTTSSTTSSPVKGSVPEDVVAVGPVPVVPLLTEPQVCLLYAWHVEELATAIARSHQGEHTKIPTRAENAFHESLRSSRIPKN